MPKLQRDTTLPLPLGGTEIAPPGSTPDGTKRLAHLLLSTTQESKMFNNDRRFGQRTEVTSPYIAIIGAAGFAILAIAAFAFWPNTDTLRTDAVANLPDNQKGSSRAPGSPN